MTVMGSVIGNEKGLQEMIMQVAMTDLGYKAATSEDDGLKNRDS